MQSRARRKLPQASDVSRLGMFGGTFDPIHYGHLICAEQLREALNLDLVMFIPSSSPPHKPDYSATSASHRLEMVRLAIEGCDHFVASDIEVLKGGVSYTVDTVREVRASYGNDVNLWLLLGMDAYLDLPTWKEPDVIAAECSFAVACRPGYVNTIDPGQAVAGKRFVDITLVEISSTGIRERLSDGRSIRFLVPESVERYIKHHKPYPSASKD
ncbi:MAG: nicotinate-nucleotide adenylyltransferase [Candidatus Eisenbacteria bacterium]